LNPGTLPSEAYLESMIVADPSILSDEWMLIGRQEQTPFGGRIDLLAVAPDGALILIELKRDKTPREVVAQALDYASWVQSLDSSAINTIYQRFSNGGDLRAAFLTRFGLSLDEAAINYTHQVVVVSAMLDDSSERIVRYLEERGVAINVLSFQVFQDGAGQLLTRAWLLDPAVAQTTASSGAKGPKEPWNGEYYASFGAGQSRSWSEAMAHGFISAGGGPWYSRTLKLLSVGDRVWVRVPQAGYVGVARVTGEALPAGDFQISSDEGSATALDVLKEADYHRADAAIDPEQAEWFVPVKWLQAVPLAQAVDEIGLFGNQNSVCRPVTEKWRQTVERLKTSFPAWNSDAQWRPRIDDPSAAADG
jgi:hypothetical protein